MRKACSRGIASIISTVFLSEELLPSRTPFTEAAGYLAECSRSFKRAFWSQVYAALI